ncbi:MAG: hypothetical protein ACI9WC_002947, partial [Arenicella sp.]
HTRAAPRVNIAHNRKSSSSMAKTFADLESAISSQTGVISFREIYLLRRLGVTLMGSVLI